MVKFIELHVRPHSTRVLLNVDDILYLEENEGGVRIYTRVPFIFSSENNGRLSNLRSKLEHFDVIESYVKVKSMIEN